MDKGTTLLYSSTGEQICINFILRNAHVCNNGIFLKNDFAITRNISEDIILGAPFLFQIIPYETGFNGISTKILGKELHFLFVKTFSPLDSETLRQKTVFKINLLSNQIGFLKQDLKLKQI